MDRTTPGDSWRALDGSGPSQVVWARPVDGRRCVVLLGAFDPPTTAHVEILHAASTRAGSPGVLCFTKVLLARAGEPLLPSDVRAGLLDAVAERNGFGLVFANRGTYVEVDRAMRRKGAEPTFVVGSDKLAQLADPSFYADGQQGVDATFGTLDLIVVPREGAPVDRPGLAILELDDPVTASISATEVRRKVLAGMSVTDLVPQEVELALRGYTSAR